MQILPIASGKGGVGKSLIAANLSIALAQSGKQVLLADLDLGGSNLHLILGARGVREGIGTFLSRNDVSFDDIIVRTDYENLLFVAGDTEIPGMANLKVSQKRKLLRRLLAQKVDYLVLDLGAGTNNTILDFFLSSGNGILVTAPNLPATLNAYLFLKNALFRIMHSAFKRGSWANRYLAELHNEGNKAQRLYIPKLMETVLERDPDSYHAFRNSVDKFHPRLIMNMLEDPKDSERALALRRSIQQYLDIDIEHLGVVYRDDLQDIALASRLPIIIYKPQSVLAQAIYRIADKLIQIETEETGPLALQDLDDSFQTAEMEAEVDFETKIHYIEELLHCGSLSTGDLVETIKTQQFEIGQLKKENQFLKAKLVQHLQSQTSPKG